MGAMQTWAISRVFESLTKGIAVFYAYSRQVLCNSSFKKLTPILRGRSNPESHMREEYATMLPMAVFWRPSSLGRIELGNTETVGPAAQFRSDHQIRNVKCDSIDEGRVIGAG